MPGCGKHDEVQAKGKSLLDDSWRWRVKGRRIRGEGGRPVLVTEPHLVKSQGRLAWVFGKGCRIFRWLVILKWEKARRRKLALQMLPRRPSVQSWSELSQPTWSCWPNEEDAGSLPRSWAASSGLGSVGIFGEGQRLGTRRQFDCTGGSCDLGA